MGTSWEIVESGPRDATRTVMLIPGGMCSAGSYSELTAEPALGGVRLVAVTVPAHAGTAPPDDVSTEAYARAAADLALDLNVDVVVGFSIGAMVAYEMAVSRSFTGPLVLLGVSLSAADEPAMLHVFIRLGAVLGTLPARLFKAGASSMVKRATADPERRNELRADLARNDPHQMRRWLRAYRDWLRRDDDPARRLCDAGNPTWVVHAEKGDGGLTDHERSVLEACKTVQLLTLPGHVFFLPIEASGRVASVIAEALEACR